MMSKYVKQSMASRWLFSKPTYYDESRALWDKVEGLRGVDYLNRRYRKKWVYWDYRGGKLFHQKIKIQQRKSRVSDI